MNEPVTNKMLREALLAVADGEADVAQRELAFAAMAERPELARFVLDQQKLRSAVGRTMTSMPEVPAGLRERIAAQANAVPQAAATAVPMAAESDASSRSAQSAPPLARLAPWFPSAVAAMLCVVAALMFMSSRQQPSPSDRVSPLVQQGPPTNVDSIHVVGSDVVEGLSFRHVSCSRLLSSLNDSVKFPTEVKNVPKAIGDYLGRSPYGVLDLSALGFKFEGAGPCAVPGSTAVHLIFRPIDRTHRDDALSLWSQPDDGSVNIKPDTMYQPAGESALHPIMLWKHADMLYYLVGDESEMVSKAAHQLASQL